MVRILVTNDDGYRSEGIHALARRCAPLGDVTIVAPMHRSERDRPRADAAASAAARAIADRVFAVDGTPTDCVNIAVTQVFKGLPDLVVSGINKGWNLGDDVTYSGTVAGALEGALLGVPASPCRCGRRAATTTSRRGARGGDDGGRDAASGRCRRGRFSTSTCRRGSRRAIA